MSWETALQISYLEDCEALEIDDVLGDQILELLDNEGIHHDVLDDFDQAFDSGVASFNVHAASLALLVESIAALCPQLSFEARGLGEEFRDTWIREFRLGELVFEAGPWEYM